MAKTKATSAKRKPVKVRVVGTCEMFASYPIRCWLCGVTVPANTPHSCKRLEKQ